MKQSDWSHWSVQERCVGEIIVEMFQANDPSGDKAVRPTHIFDGYYEHLKEMWIPKPSLSSDRKRDVDKIFEVCA